MRILITGGAGFIGSHTAEALVRGGHSVRILDNLDPQVHGPDAQFPETFSGSVECLRGDVRDPNDVDSALDGVDAVYHLASLTGVGQSMYEMRSYFDVNCTGTATVLERIIRRKHPLRRFVLASSRAVYGEGTYSCERCGKVFPPMRAAADLSSGRYTPKCPNCHSHLKPVPTDEERPLTPVSVYGSTKKQQEEQCGYVAQMFGLPVVCLRYFNVYGSRQSLKNPYTGVVSVFYNRIVAGEPISLYENGTPIRDFVHISDVVQANLLALTATIEPGACINVATGIGQTVREVAQALYEACGKEPTMAESTEFRSGDVWACYANLARAQQLLSYEPRVRLQDGLREWTAWARRQECVDLYEHTVRELRQYGLFGRAVD